jgi:uncharacterized SAM-binding protein YcdF (DUF218 family)
MPRLNKKFLRAAAVAAVIAGTLSLALALWLHVSLWPGRSGDTLTSADIIVILGGDTGERAPLGLALYQEGKAPLILVCGDNGEILAYLRKAGVAEHALIHENESTNTWENGEFSVPLLRQRGARRVILVTSWYHAGRSKAVFERLLPECDFQISCTAPPATLTPKDRHLLKRERSAMLGYWLKYRISLF